MATTPITASTRYINPGVTRCYFLPACANTAAPTRAEMNAGTDLSREIADIAGWVVAGNEVETPDLVTNFTGNIPGRVKADGSSISCYASTTGVDVRAALPRNTTGYIMWLDGGDVPGQKADVFPIRVLSNGKPRGVGETAALIVVQCSVTSQPAENVTIPA